MADKPPTPSLDADDTDQHTTIDEVHAWAVVSPYSPLNLQHLPQPRPSGVPRGLAGGLTFRDAFEDLLVAGSGRPLPPPGGRPLGQHVVDWVRGLDARGCWDAYFRMEGPAARWRPLAIGDGTLAEADARLYFHEPGAAAAARRRAPLGQYRAHWGPADDHIDTRAIWGAAWRLAVEHLSRWDWDEEGRGRERARAREREADVEDELYDTDRRHSPLDPDQMREREREGEPLDKGELMKWVLQQRSPASTATALPPPAAAAAAPDVTTTVYPDGTRSVQTTEHSGADGRTRTTTTTRIYDAAGNLLSETHETSTTRVWSGTLPGSVSWSWNTSSSSRGGSDAWSRRGSFARGDERGNGGRGSDGEDRDRDRDRDTDGRDEEKGAWGGRRDDKKGWFWNR